MAGAIAVIQTRASVIVPGSRPKGPTRRLPSRQAQRTSEKSSDSNTKPKQKAHTDLFSGEAIASLGTTSTSIESSSVTKKAAPNPPATRQKQDTLFDDFLSGPPAKPTATIDKIESEIAEETGPFSSKRGAAKVRFSLDDDLFGSTKEPSASKSGDQFGQEPDELFATQKPKPASKSTRVPIDDPFAAKPSTAADDMFGKSPKLETKKTNAKIHPDIFAAPPEDVFSASGSGEKKTQDTDDLFSSTAVGQFGSGIKGSAGSKGLDDLFADATPKPKKATQAEKVVGGEEGVDAGESKLEPEKPTKAAAEGERKKKPKTKGAKKEKSKKAKGRPDEDLFGNTDDIFGDIPAAKPKSPKPKKKKKKVEQSAATASAGVTVGEAEQALGDPDEEKSALDEDADKAKKSTNVKKKTKKSEPKDLSIFDDNAPSIFDDPLNALGNN